MIARLIERLFGCRHEHTTFPMSPRTAGGRLLPVHVTCLGCGREFPYDWAAMRREDGFLEPSGIPAVLSELNPHGGAR